jgi:predicted alpha/beta-fold hydrolase
MPTTSVEPYAPPWWLRNPHVQTVVGSRGRAYWVDKRARSLKQASERRLVQATSGARLETWHNLQNGRPAVIIIHGWLGHADSGYVLSAATALASHGFSVVRLNLRDHGETTDLNEQLFHSARIDEVVDAVAEIRSAIGEPVALLGFSLGGNFALRVASATGIPALAVCPAMDPAASTTAIDQGLAIYRWFFVRKWHAALAAKQAAFPELYDFGPAMNLRRVASLTELFVREYTPFHDLQDYFDRYTLTGRTLSNTPGTIVYAEDDPVIPTSGFADLPASLKVVPIRRGGHCAFVTKPSEASWIDHFAVAEFTEWLC